ncbi:MAG: transglycosylase domain-containing protein [Dehalococcoidia bacterium]|nr:transglycosylase domain-containing protein [Dehalococcoidia bacterium]
MTSAHRSRRRRLRQLNGGRQRSSPPWLWLLSALGLLMLAFGALGSGAAFAVYYHYSHDLARPDIALARTGSAGSRIFDRNGNLLYEFVDPLSGLKNPVPMSEISPWLIQATVSTEDASFYDNPGVNIKGLMRAAMENLTPFGPGFFKGSGGSSITQQLVKNVYIPPEERTERSLGRKIKEVVMAIELKRRYSDNQILEWYLNQVYYGNFAYGAEAAAWRYFGKPAKNLTLAEAAMLAGIPSAPGYYSPVIPENRPEAARRQQYVLDLMVEHGYITQQQADEAKKEELVFEEGTFPIRAPHFVFYVKDVITKMCEKGQLQLAPDTDCSQLVDRGGLRVTTSLDLPLQQRAEGIIENVISANENIYGGHNAAAVVIEPATGEILAMVGSRNYDRADIDGEVNITTSERSPGSSIKVYTYLAAFLQGWTPATIVRDEPIDIKSASGQPIQNWNFSFKGPVTVRTALSESINIAAVRTILAVGVETVVDVAHKMGITSLNEPDRYGPALTLGGGEVKLLDHTYAYSVFANSGLMVGMPTVEDLPAGYRQLDPVGILAVENALGTVLYEYKGADSLQVVPANYAYLITDILSKSAIQWALLTISRPAAAKTGTSEGFHDSLVMGYTPDRAVGVWMGNADNTPMAEGTFSFAGAGPIWKQIMEAAHEGIPSHDFVAPKGVYFSPCAGRMEVFVEGTACTYVVPRPIPVPAVGPTPAATGTPGLPPTGTPATPGAAPSATPAITPASTPHPEPSQQPAATPKPTAQAIQ